MNIVESTLLKRYQVDFISYQLKSFFFFGKHFTTKICITAIIKIVEKKIFMFQLK